MIQHSCSARVQWPCLADFRPVGLILPVFLRILPDILCDEWPSNLLTRLKCTLCVIWSKKKNKKKTGISIVAVVLSYALPLGLAWQPDWWQISVIMSARNIVFLQNSFQLPMSALILSMYMISALHEIEAVCFNRLLIPWYQIPHPSPSPPSNL